MKGGIMWFVVSSLMALSLVIAACGQTSTPATPTAPSESTPRTTAAAPVAPAAERPQQGATKADVQMPKYGGVITVARNADLRNWDPIFFTSGATQSLTHEAMWAGDWTKGPAGGHGTRETDWAMSYDILAHKSGRVAESWKWTVDLDKNEGTLVYQLRRGNRFGLNPGSEASRLVNGREVTADDVVFSLTKFVTDPLSRTYGSNPELRVAKIAKTGALEVTAKLPVDALISAISRFGSYGRIVPPEVYQKYVNMDNWRTSVGSGPFILIDYVPGSTAVLIKNPNYWGKDPIGPGKGNQLPYVDGFRILIIPDASTRMAALRTGKIDRMADISWDDAVQFRKTNPHLLEFEMPVSGTFAAKMRTDKAPFNDVRVRRAMMMATDFNAILQGLYRGVGQIHTWPFVYNPTYADLYLGLDDPAMPASVKELYTHSPEKARQLLKEAGYPDGFKTEILLTSDEVDYYSVIKDMWAKVGIDLKLDVRESGVKNTIMQNRQHNAITTSGGSPVATYYLAPDFTGTASTNGSMIDDPIVNETIAKVRLAVLTDEKQAMKLIKDMMPYFLGQAWAIPRVGGPSYDFWWPWLRNYSGEDRVGYGAGNPDMWSTFVWYDGTLKKSMGY